MPGKKAPIRQRQNEDGEEEEVQQQQPQRPPNSAAAATTTGNKKKDKKKAAAAATLPPVDQAEPMVESVYQNDDADNNNNADQKQQQQQPATSKMILHSLNHNVEEIYRDTLQRLCGPNVQLSNSTSSSSSKGAKKSSNAKDDAADDKKEGPKTDAGHFFVDDNETATILIRFADKASAKKLAHRLHRAQLFGTQVQAKCVPTATLEPTYVPCGVKITEIWSPAIQEQQQQHRQGPKKQSAMLGHASSSSSAATAAAMVKFSLNQLQQYLASSNPGFLGVTEITEDKQQRRSFIATYADSGAALQARALMSGRAFHGSHLLFERVKGEDMDEEA